MILLYTFKQLLKEKKWEVIILFWKRVFVVKKENVSKLNYVKRHGMIQN